VEAKLFGSISESGAEDDGDGWRPVMGEASKFAEGERRLVSCGVVLAGLEVG
jgi:hypothetical protein